MWILSGFLFYFIQISVAQTYTSDILPFSGTVCETTECKRSANYLRNAMNITTDPCEDFYKYACGNYVGQDDYYTCNGFVGQIQLNIIEKLKTSVIDKATLESEPKSLKNARLFHRKCMEYYGTNLTKEMEPVFEILKKINVSTNPFTYVKTNFNPYVTMVKFSSIFADYFGFDVQIFENGTKSYQFSWKNGSRFSGPSIFDEFYLNGMDDLVRFMYKDDKFNYSTKNHLIKDKLTQLKQILIDRKKLEQEKPLFNDTSSVQKMKLSEFQNFIDSLLHEPIGRTAWTEYFTTFLKQMKIHTADPEKDIIIMVNERYFRLIFSFIHRNAERLDILFWYDVLMNLIPGAEKEASTIYQYCTVQSIYYFGTSLTYPLVNAQTERDKEKVLEMANLLKQMIKNELKTINWLDQEMKNKLIKHVENMKNVIFYPSWIANKSAVDEHYKNSWQMQVENRNYTELKIDINNFLNSTKENYNETEVFKKDRFSISPLMPDGFHIPSDNMIYISLGIAQYPFYGHSVQALNFGVLASLIGHELIHGVDRLERAERNDTEYKQRRECFIRAYNQIKMPNLNDTIDGNKTLDENVADNGGFRFALMAYREFTKIYGAERLLPTFEHLNQEQLFTLAHAKRYCINRGVKHGMNSRHAPGEARLLGTLRNSEEFAEIWKCEKGSGMNPLQKCKLW